MPARFRSRQRLRTRAEFDDVFKRGQRLDGRLFSLVVKPNGRGEHRLGLAVSRRVGGAVARNRAKRLVRESFRRLEPPARGAFDLVVLAKPELASSSLAEVSLELGRRLGRLERGSGTRRARPAPRS